MMSRYATLLKSRYTGGLAEEIHGAGQVYGTGIGLNAQQCRNVVSETLAEHNGSFTSFDVLLQEVYSRMDCTKTGRPVEG